MNKVEIEEVSNHNSTEHIFDRYILCLINTRENAVTKTCKFYSKFSLFVYWRPKTKLIHALAMICHRRRMRSHYQSQPVNETEKGNNQSSNQRRSDHGRTARTTTMFLENSEG